MNLQKWSIQCIMFLTKQFVYEYDINSSSGLLFIMCGNCYYIDPAAVRTCMQTNFTVHGQPPQFPRASAANALNILVLLFEEIRNFPKLTNFIASKH